MNNTNNKNKNAQAINSSSLCSKSPDSDTFVDVNCMIMNEKLENFIINANRQLTDKKQLCETLTNLIENICSLIEYEKKSDDIQKFKSELLTKINEFQNNFEMESSTKQKEIKSNPSKEVSIQTDFNSLSSNEKVNHSNTIQESLDLNSFEKLSLGLANEINMIRAETNMFKNKIKKQNELIKILINNCSRSQHDCSSSIDNNNKSISTIESVSQVEKISNPIQKDNHNQNDNSDEEDDDYLSPGSSPTEFVLDKISKIRLKKSKTSQIEPKDTETDTLTEENVNLPKEDFTYMYNLNGFIAVDSNLKYGNQLDNETNSNSNMPTTSNRESSIFKCPKCQISIDSNQLSANTIYQHINICDLDKYNVIIYIISK
jgi:hypothetical protein